MKTFFKKKILILLDFIKISSLAIFIAMLCFPLDLLAQNQVSLRFFWPTPYGKYESLKSLNFRAARMILNTDPSAATAYTQFDFDGPTGGIDISSSETANNDMHDGVGSMIANRYIAGQIEIEKLYVAGVDVVDPWDGHSRNFNSIFGVPVPIAQGYTHPQVRTTVSFRKCKIPVAESLFIGRQHGSTGYFNSYVASLLTTGLVDILVVGLMAWVFCQVIECVDIAENFEVSDISLSPADVVIIDINNGKLKMSHKSYDNLVAGIVSTNPALILGTGGSRSKIIQQEFEADINKFLSGEMSKETLQQKHNPSQIQKKLNLIENKRPIAIAGTVPCKVDASFGAIEAGDLLTSSNTPGHAMKATIDSADKIGTIIGKALESLEEGKGVINVLVMLR